MTVSPLKALDDLIAPILVAANIIRQARDALPAAMWSLVPAPIRTPMDALFEAVERYDRTIGLMREAGVFPPKPHERPDPG